MFFCCITPLIVIFRLVKLSRNSLRDGEKEENCKTCAMKTLLYTFVDVGLLAKLFAKVLLEEAAVVSISEFTTFLCQRIRFIATATGLISSF